MHLLPHSSGQHTILNCFKVENDKKALTVNSDAIIDYSNDKSNKYLYPNYDHNVPDTEEEEEQKPQYQNKQYKHNSISFIACHILNKHR